MMNRRLYTVLALVLAVIVFAGVNIFADATFTTARLDLTENGSYTISPGTKAIIAKLPEPVTLTFYYSKKTAAAYAATEAYARQVRDLLGQYAALSHGKIILREVDPEPFTPEEDEAGAAGLTPAPTDSGDVVYFGLAGSNSIDGKEAISYFAPDRQPYLEYDISALLDRLSHPKKPVLGLIASAALDQPQQTPAILAALRQGYQLRSLGAGFTQIPQDIDVLIVAAPPPLSADQLSAIDTFVKKGGRALIFADPLAEMAEAQMGAPPGDLGKLLAGWGIGFDPNKVVLDRSLAQRVATSADPRNPTALYPLWLHLTAANFNSRDPITANLTSLNVASAGALYPLPGTAKDFESLIETSDQAMLAPRDAAATVADPSQLMALAIPSGHRYSLAARLTNRKVVVVADSDLLDDRFWVRTGAQPDQAEPFADNGALVLDAVENLTGSSDLIALRTRTNTDRPFTVVRAMQEAAETKFRETVDALQARLAATEQQLQQLNQGGSGGRALALSPQQQADIARLKEELATTRAQLRDVQRNLRADIDALGAELAFLNVAAMPLAVIAFALALAFIRRRRMAR